MTRLGVDKVKPKGWFKFFDRQVVGTILKLSYFLNFFVGHLLHGEECIISRTDRRTDGVTSCSCRSQKLLIIYTRAEWKLKIKINAMRFIVMNSI